MAKMPLNVERNTLHKGRHIGYDALGFAFRIDKESNGYSARPSYLAKAGDHRFFWAKTLRELGTKLEQSKREV